MSDKREHTTEYSGENSGELRILIARAGDLPHSENEECEASATRSKAKTESALSQKLTAAALGIYLGRVPSEEELAGELRTPGRKPCFPAYPDFCYNISHSAGVAVCAVSDHPVGIDLQMIPENPRNAMRIAKRFFSGEEQDALSALSDRGEQEALCCLFCRYWTARESYIKLTGKGLTESFSSYSPDLEAGVIRVPGPGSSTDSSPAAYLTECPAPAGFCLTVCSDVPLPPCSAQNAPL